MAEITTTLSYPYYGSSGSSALPGNFSASVIGVAGRPYLLDTTGGRYNRRGITVVQQRNTSDQRDILLLPQDIWRQSAESWHLGKGQSNQDRNDSLSYRYNDSFGMDPWTKYEFSLLPETIQLGGSASVYTGDVWLTTHAGFLVVVNSDDIHLFNDLSASATAASTFTPDPGNNVIAIADDGHVITTLHADGKIYKTQEPTYSPTLWKTLPNSTFVDWVKDYLLVGEANVLKDATGSGSPKVIYTHPDTSFRWVQATEGNQAIYALGGFEDRWMVHKVTIKDDGTGLNPGIVAATLPDGEIGYSIGRYLDFVFIGTNKGVRMATMQDNGDLTLGPILPTTKPVRCFEGQDRFVWFGLSEMLQPYASLGPETYPSASAVCGLGRMDLSSFTVSALTPAWANDIFAADQSGHDVEAVVTYKDKRVFAMNGHVYFEGTNKVSSGWLTQGVMSFSIEDPKSALYQQLKWNPNCAGRAMLDLAFDSNSFGRYANLQVTASSIRSDNLNFNGTAFSRAEVRYVLNRCSIDNTKAPRITRWEFRASPIKGKASRWELPIMNYDEIEIDGVTYTRNVLDELDTLMNLVESGTVFVYQESGRSYQVHARDFVWQPEKLSANGNGWQGVFTLVIEEVL